MLDETASTFQRLGTVGKDKFRDMMNGGRMDTETVHQKAVDKAREEKENKLDRLREDTLNFFEQFTARIEVVRDDGHLERVYFYIPPFCKALSEVIYYAQQSFSFLLGYKSYL